MLGFGKAKEERRLCIPGAAARWFGTKGELANKSQVTRCEPHSIPNGCSPFASGLCPFGFWRRHFEL